MAEPSIHKREEEPKVSLIPLIALIFYNVSGGPFGVEDSVRAAGPLLAILGFIIFPFFWSVPESMVTAELSTAFPVNGGYVMWISEAFGPFWGFQGGFWKWISGMIDNALYPVLFLDYIKQSAPIFASGVIRTVSIWFITFALTYLNYRGLTVVGYVAVGLAVVSLVPFVLMGVLSIPRIKPSRWLITDLNTVHWRDYLNNLFWNLNYWDKASTLAGEVKNPSETFPKALYFAIPAVVCSYLVPLLAGTGAVAFSRSSWEDGYFATVGLLIGGRWLRLWIQGAAALSNMGLFEAEMSSDSYQLLGMAENGMLPKFFARRSVHGTPVYGIAFSAFGVLALSWMSFQEIVEFLNFLYGFGMLLELAAFVALRYGRPDIRRPYKAPVGNTGSVLVCLPPAVLLLLVMGFATVRTLVVSFGVLVMGFLLYGVLEVSKRRKWLEYAEESPEDASSALLAES